VTCSVGSSICDGRLNKRAVCVGYLFFRVCRQSTHAAHHMHISIV